jgi:hypothetical protein
VEVQIADHGSASLHLDDVPILRVHEDLRVLARLAADAIAAPPCPRRHGKRVLKA